MAVGFSIEIHRKKNNEMHTEFGPHTQRSSLLRWCTPQGALQRQRNVDCPWLFGGSSVVSLQVSFDQWEFQDPKMEVLYHIRPYFGGISPYIALKNMPYIWNRYLQSILGS